MFNADVYWQHRYLLSQFVYWGSEHRLLMLAFRTSVHQTVWRFKPTNMGNACHAVGARYWCHQQHFSLWTVIWQQCLSGGQCLIVWMHTYNYCKNGEEKKKKKNPCQNMKLHKTMRNTNSYVNKIKTINNKKTWGHWSVWTDHSYLGKLECLVDKETHLHLFLYCRQSTERDKWVKLWFCCSIDCIDWFSEPRVRMWPSSYVGRGVPTYGPQHCTIQVYFRR